MPSPVYPPPPCDQCTAKCCTNKAPWNFISLTPAEATLFRAKGAKIVEDKDLGTGFFFQQGENAGCQFLKGARCTVYADRPAVCRGFICTNPTFENVDVLIKDNPELAAILHTRSPKLATL